MLSCQIISPAEQIIQQDLEAIYLQTIEGSIGVLPGHISLVTKLKDNSLVRFKTITEDAEVKFRVGDNSFFKFSADQGIIITRRFVKAEDY